MTERTSSFELERVSALVHDPNQRKEMSMKVQYRKELALVQSLNQNILQSPQVRSSAKPER